ncbi:YihY/virulence factor BrkB family protein [Marinobacter sp.]|uniref:YihY/virulence factor BrkB family protein n=1 Tax=Marinobacter sp. TaxID=50741 RepID=UPI00384A7916
MPSIEIKDRLKKTEEWILANPNPPERGPWSWLYTTARVLYALGRDLVAGNLTLHAMSLVYTTLLSIVPLLALSFSVLKALDVHERVKPFVYQFFQPMGPEGVEMADRVLKFVDNIKVGVLGSVGLVILIYTVISLVQKIERSFNMIWQVPEMRSVGQRFSNYLSVIMIGPLLMVSAIGISATVLTSDIVQALAAVEPFGTVIATLSRLMPFLLVCGAFTFFYAFMPNTRVYLRYALIGGVIAGITWQAASILFATTVATSARYAAIYSSFAIGIIMLIWLYLNWLILLLGASITFYLQNPGAIAKRQDVQFSPELQEKVALTLMWLVCRPFSAGRPAPQQEKLEQKMRVPGAVTRRVSDKLIRGGLLSLAGADGDRLVPGRTLDLISVDDILDAVRRDEDGIARRLPAVLPSDLSDRRQGDGKKTLSELLKDDAEKKEQE